MRAFGLLQLLTPCMPPACPPPAAADPSALYDFVPLTSVLGTTAVKTGKILDSSSLKYSEVCGAVPVPAVFDDKGIRMALKDPRHSKEPLATFAFTCQLHVVPDYLKPKAAS